MKALSGSLFIVLFVAGCAGQSPSNRRSRTIASENTAEKEPIKVEVNYTRKGSYKIAYKGKKEILLKPQDIGCVKKIEGVAVGFNVYGYCHIKYSALLNEHHHEDWQITSYNNYRVKAPAKKVRNFDGFNFPWVVSGSAKESWKVMSKETIVQIEKAVKDDCREKVRSIVDNFCNEDQKNDAEKEFLN